jgi:hypothetical protein
MLNQVILIFTLVGGAKTCLCDNFTEHLL